MSDLAFVELDLQSMAVSTRWAENWTGCLLHGFGASAQDLVPLVPALAGARRWILPHAPMPITIAGMAYGRAWFPRDEGTMQEAVYGGYFRSLRQVEPEGLRHAATEVRKLLTDRGVDWSRLILGGFSQGAMVTAEILRQASEDPSQPAPAVALLFSGALIAEAWWTPRSGAEGTDNLPRLVIQSHGTDDPVLPYSEGEALAEALRRRGITPEWIPFSGRHEIPESVVTTVGRRLSETIF